METQNELAARLARIEELLDPPEGWTLEAAAAAIAAMGIQWPEGNGAARIEDQQ